MWVRYFVPEDGDDMNHPNVFRVNSNSITLGDLKKAFPLTGKFQFRVLKQIGQRNIWLDLSNDSETIPGSNNAIILKVSRILEPRTTAPVSSTPSVPAPAPVVPPRVREEPPKPKPIAVPAPAPVDEGLLDFDDVPAPKSAPVKSAAPAAPAPAFDDDLLGINSAPSSVPAAKSSSQADPFAADPFGLSTLQPTTSASSNAFPSSPSTNPMFASTGSARMPAQKDPFSGMSSNPMVGNPMAGGPMAGGRGMAPPQQQGMGMNQNRPAGGFGNNNAFDPFSNLGAGNSNQFNSTRRY